MDLRQLRQFVAIAEERSFRQAAERLHISQPPLTVAVQRLEADLGVQLLDRNRQGVRLTPAGEAFLQEARRTLAQAQNSVDIAQRAAQGKLGTLRFSFVPSAGLTLVPQLLRTFRRDHPDVKFILSGETTSQQMAALVQGNSDVAIVVPPLHEAQEVHMKVLRQEELVLAVPAEHALGARQRVQLRDLAGEDFVGFALKDGPGFESVVMSACQDSGFMPRFVQTASQMQSILALVASGMGVALVPQAMRAMQVEQVHYLQVRKRNAPLRYALGLAYHRRNANPALAAFLAMAERVRSG